MHGLLLLLLLMVPCRIVFTMPLLLLLAIRLRGNA
jgi:hypothetical protein